MIKNDNIKISCLTSLYKCEEYLDTYFSHVENIKNLNDVEFIFIHNNPTLEEKRIINRFLGRNIIHYKYVEVPREGLYKSWNRGINLATGEFVATWNVDDIRFPDSFKNQLSGFTDENIGLVYGDKIVKTSENDIGILTKAREFNKKKGMKKFQDGAFLMWRKSVHDKIGFFDEQFISLGDQDFWYRVLEHYSIKKCEGILGVFLAEPGKGISKSSNLPSIEKIIIGLRYGFFTYIDPFGWRKARKGYDVRNIIFDDKKLKRKQLKYSNTGVYLISLSYIVLSFFKR